MTNDPVAPVDDSGLADELCAELLAERDTTKWRNEVDPASPYCLWSSVESLDVLYGVLEALYGSCGKNVGCAARGVVVVDDGRQGGGSNLNSFWEAVPQSVSYVGFEEETWSVDRKFVRRTSKGERVDARDVKAHNFSLERVHPIGPAKSGEAVYLLKCWQTTAKDGKSLTWLEVYGKHKFMEGISIVNVSNVHPEVDGKHEVHSVKFTTEATEGPNLLAFTGVPIIEPIPGSSLIWDWGNAHGLGRPAGICSEIASMHTNVTLYYVRILDIPIQAQPAPVVDFSSPFPSPLPPAGSCGSSVEGNAGHPTRDAFTDRGWSKSNYETAPQPSIHIHRIGASHTASLQAQAQGSSGESGQGVSQQTSFTSPCNDILEEAQTGPPGLEVSFPKNEDSSVVHPSGTEAAEATRGEIWNTPPGCVSDQTDARDYGVATEGEAGNSSSIPPGLNDMMHANGGPPGLLPGTILARTNNAVHHSGFNSPQQLMRPGPPGLDLAHPTSIQPSLGTTQLSNEQPMSQGMVEYRDGLHASGVASTSQRDGKGETYVGGTGLPSVCTPSQSAISAGVPRSGPPGLTPAGGTSVFEPALPTNRVSLGSSGPPGLTSNQGPPGLLPQGTVHYTTSPQAGPPGLNVASQSSAQDSQSYGQQNGVSGPNSVSNPTASCSSGPPGLYHARETPGSSQGEGGAAHASAPPGLLVPNNAPPVSANGAGNNTSGPQTPPLMTASVENVPTPSGPPGLLVSATPPAEIEPNEAQGSQSVGDKDNGILLNAEDNGADGGSSESGSFDSEDEEIIPFDPESFGLKAPNCSPEMLHAGVVTLKALVERMLLDAVQSLRFVMHGDSSGCRSRKQLFDSLSKGVEGAVMQRGNGLCLVVQRLFRCITEAVCSSNTAPMFQGAVLLHLLYGLEDIHTSRQVNIFTCMQELAPSNPFQHMDGAATLAERYNRRGGTAMDFSNLPSPYVADIAQVPNFTEVEEVNINRLFRNAPFLLKKEATLPKFVNKMKDYVSQKESGPLRRYQEESVKRVDGGGNWIFVAPTGAGKTKIFVECSRRLLQKNCYGTIVVVCPTVPLATQQACVYVVEGFLQERYWVNVFTAENQLKPELWDQIVYTHNVMVMTPQAFLNVMFFHEKQHPLSEGNQIFHTIDMLVLDECHHTRKEHPYNKIMHAYRATEGCQTQILGFTASPVKSTQLEECKVELDNLLKNMRAKCVVIGDENEEVQKYVPSARERTVYTQPRPADQSFALSIGKFMWEACKKHLQPLVGKVSGVVVLPENCKADMCKGIHSSFFENWTKTTAEHLEKNYSLSYFARMDIKCSCEVIRCCNNSLDLLKDGGFESALKYLAKKCTELSQKLSGQLDFREWIYPKILAGLYATRPIQSARTVLQAFRMSPDTSDFKRLPRFVELVKFLDGYSEHETFHGIVFVKTRDGVYHLASMLRNHPQLRFLTPIEFIGHGRAQRRTSSKAGYLDTDAANDATKGMTGNKQREILDRFSMPGRHVLVATSAAEEGINVATCEFVVRYSVTETGIQRIQSRGRTRKNNGVFFNIIEQESKEDEIYEKSRHEEKIMNIVLRLSQDVEHL